MTIDERQRRESNRRVLIIGGGISVLAHLLILAVLGPLWVDRELEPIEPAEPAESEELTVEATWEEPDPEPKPKPEPPEAEPEIVERPKPPEPEPEPEEEPEKVESRELDRKVVEQQTNEEAPEEARFLSDEANRVPEETRARETTPDPAPRAEQAEVKTEEEIASLREVRPERPRRRTPEPTPQPEPEPQELERDPDETRGRDPVIVKKRPPPRKLLVPDMKNYERMFAEADERAAERAEENEPKKRLFEGYEELNGKVKASLENFIHEVKPGNHTGVNAHKSVYASYVGKIHRKIHLRWANRYLMDLDLYEPRGSPMNDPGLNTTLEFVIRAGDGELESVNIVSGSGQTRFDAQAVSIAYAVGPHPDPPPEIVSPDGKVYIHWNFWRDQRQCGTFGASVYLVDNEKG